MYKGASSKGVRIDYLDRERWRCLDACQLLIGLTRRGFVQMRKASNKAPRSAGSKAVKRSSSILSGRALFGGGAARLASFLKNLVEDADVLRQTSLQTRRRRRRFIHGCR